MISDRDAVRFLAQSKAKDIWLAMDKNQRAGVRFGMFPAQVMQAAIAEGHDSRLLSVALMDCAERDGGMCA